MSTKTNGKIGLEWREAPAAPRRITVNSVGVDFDLRRSRFPTGKVSGTITLQVLDGADLLYEELLTRFEKDLGLPETLYKEMLDALGALR